MGTKTIIFSETHDHASVVGPCDGSGAGKVSLSPPSSQLQRHKSFHKVFPISEGDGEEINHKSLHIVFPVVEAGGEEVYRKPSGVQKTSTVDIPLLILSEALERVTLPTERETVVLADLGSSLDTNAIGNVGFMVDKLRPWVAKDVEFQAYFNAFFPNDFNKLFRMFGSDSRVNNIFTAGIPGSYFGRLFSQSSVHVFYSSFCLHWLSEVPYAVLDKASPAYNRGNIWIAHSRSDVARSYQQQASFDMRNFLLARAAELVSGGLLFFICSGRATSEPNEVSEFLADLNDIWSDLVAEGLLTEEHTDSFNVPCYLRSIEEMREAVASCTSVFHVLAVKQHTIELSNKKAFATSEASLWSRKTGAAYREFMNNLFEAHVGKKLSEVIWQRYEKLVEKKLSKSPHGQRIMDQMCIVSLIRK